MEKINDLNSAYEVPFRIERSSISPAAKLMGMDAEIYEAKWRRSEKK